MREAAATSQEEEKVDLGRRNFLRLCVLGAVTAAGVAVGLKPGEAKADQLNLSDLKKQLAAKKAELQAGAGKNKAEIAKLQKEIDELQARIDARNKKQEASMGELANVLEQYK